MGKDLESNAYEEQLRSCGLFSPKQRGLRGGFMAAVWILDGPGWSQELTQRSLWVPSNSGYPVIR